MARDRCTLLVQDQITPAGSTIESLVVTKGLVAALAVAAWAFASGGSPSCRASGSTATAHAQDGSVTVGDIDLFFLCHLSEIRIDKRPNKPYS